MKNIEKHNRGKTALSFICSVFSAVGIAFLFFAYSAGTDDILTLRETVFLGIIFLSVFTAAYLFSLRLSAKTMTFVFLCAAAGAAALNFEFPELMRLPFQLPAENLIIVTGHDEGASLSMTWAYFFRPRTQEEDIFLTNPDRDISFSHLTKTGNWEESADGDAPVLLTWESGTALGIPKNFRTQLAVLCLKSEGGSFSLNISGNSSSLVLTPEMTQNQPYRMVLTNGLLPEHAGNILQIILWSGAFCFAILCGISLSRVLRKYCRGNDSVICLCAFLLPCLIMGVLCVFLKITPFGEKSFLINDMWGEYADYMSYFRTILSGENDLFYSFSKSLGDDLLPLLAFYVINPLNWLVCLFPPEKLPLAVTFLVLLRYGIAGLTAAVYFVKRRNCGFSALLFSTCYALMSFNIVNAENTNLRESALVLPLVIMGLEQLVENGSLKTYVPALAAAIFLNFYSGYQICAFAALYFLFCCLLKPDSGRFFRKLFRFVFASLTAVGITAVLLLPVVLQLRNGPKTYDPSILNFSINMPWTGLFGKLLTSAYDAEQFKAEGLPNLYIGLSSAILLSIFFLNRKISRRKRLLTAGLFVCFLLIMQLNPIDLALHGFNRPGWWPYRYSFIICFLLLGTAQESFAACSGWKKTGFLLTAVLFILLVWRLSTADYGWMTAGSLKLNTVLFLALLLMFSLGIKKNVPETAVILGMLTSLELFLNAAHVLTINTAYERSNTVSDYLFYYAENKPVFDWIRENDKSFYRVEKNHFRTANDPMLFGYNGITHYSSTLNRKVMNFLPRVGFRYYPYRFLYWEGSDTAIDSLLGIKYLVSEGNTKKPYTPVFSTDKYTVYENPLALPLSFTASPEILETDLSSGKGGFAYQESIFSSLTGGESGIFHPAKLLSFSAEQMTMNEDPGENCYRPDKEEPGSLVWELTAESSDTLYAFFPAENIFPASLSLNGKPFGRYFDNFSYHILRLGMFEPGETITLAMQPEEEQICLNDAQFYHEDLSSLERAVTFLKQDPTELRKITSSHLTGSFTASDEKLLFFSIPYSSGWTIRIDGQKVPVHEVFGTFMAVQVPEGEHSVDLRYIPSGLIPGLIISLISIAVFIFTGKKNEAD